MNKLVRVIVDPTVDKGRYVIGGVRLVSGSDRELGMELRTTEVRVHDEDAARRLISIVRRTEGLELRK